MNALAANGFNGMHDNFLLNNMNTNMGNLGMSNWVGHLKNNSGSLFDRLPSQTISEHLIHKANMERLYQSDHDQKML